MKTKTLLTLSVSLLIFCSCVVSKIKNEHAKSTPGCIPMNEKLLCDQSEATNFHWLEYMYWTGRVFGEDSEEYKAVQPDTKVWRDVLCDSSYIEKYLRSPDFRNFPVVGISQEQAEAFSKWRSDRVFEWTLIKKGILEFNPTATDTAAFTIEKYFQGNYMLPYNSGDSTIMKRIAPDFSIPYPVYRLPNAADRIVILDYIDSTDYIYHQKKAREYEKWRMTNLPFLLAHTPCIEDSLVEIPTRHVEPALDGRNRYKLIHNSRGNVAEWGEEPNITYGGGWPHNVEYVLSKDTISVTDQNAWTGFRNVCEWKYWGK
ncbi:MAG: hypothetical protein Crog4KO_32180 [Crocinitomicaceae bacterium]